MTTVKEFKKWLDEFDDDVEVQVAVQSSAGMYESYGPICFRDPFENATEFHPGHVYYYERDRILELGEAD